MKLSVILSETANNMKRFADLVFQSAAILAAALYLLGMYFILESNVRAWLKNLEHKIEISCYISDRASESAVRAALSEIASLEPVEEAKYVSKNDALVNFVSDPEIGEQIKILGENPLPASITIRLRKKTPASVEKFVGSLKETYGRVFEEITYGREEIANLTAAYRWLRYGGTLLWVVFFSLTSVILVLTMRISRAERKDELVIMKLVGAERSFFVTPFFYEGVITGLAGFVFAFLALVLTYYLFGLKFPILFMELHHVGILIAVSVAVPFICDFIVLGKSRLE